MKKYRHEQSVGRAFFSLIYSIIFAISNWEHKRTYFVAIAGLGIGLGISIGVLQSPTFVGAGIQLPAAHTLHPSQLVTEIVLVERNAFVDISRFETVTQYDFGTTHAVIDSTSTSNNRIPNPTIGMQLQLKRANNSVQKYSIVSVRTMNESAITSFVRSTNAAFVYAYRSDTVLPEYTVLTAK